MQSSRSRLALSCALTLSIAFTATSRARGQETSRMSLAGAREAAQRWHPSLTAAREAVTAARARERQAGAHANPTVSYRREQTSGDGQSNAQNIAAIDQPIELFMRGPRRDAARARREAAEARLAYARVQLDYDVTVAYGNAVAADRRARIAQQTANAFSTAVRVSQQRLTAGDIAGYAHRRLRLEGARAATQRAEAVLASRTARLALVALTSASSSPGFASQLVLTDTTGTPFPLPPADSLVARALRDHTQIRALGLDAEAAAAEARLVARERMPVPVLSAGVKNERVAQPGETASSLDGFVAGISLPLPLFDRRSAAVAAAEAQAREQRALLEVQRRRVMRDVLEAHESYMAAQEQLALLEPVMRSDSRAALTAAEVAYAEGEITLTEWLDVLRAYRDTETAYVALRGELLLRRAALQRAAGYSPSSIPPVHNPPEQEEQR